MSMELGTPEIIDIAYIEVKASHKPEIDRDLSRRNWISNALNGWHTI